MKLARSQHVDQPARGFRRPTMAHKFDNIAEYNP